MIGADQACSIAPSQLEMYWCCGLSEQVASLPCRRGHGGRSPAAKDEAAGTRWNQGAAAVDGPRTLSWIQCTRGNKALTTHACCCRMGETFVTACRMELE